jgi:hypothetical protein
MVALRNRERICGCRDPEQLERWCSRVKTAPSLAEVLADGEGRPLPQPASFIVSPAYSGSGVPEHTETGWGDPSWAAQVAPDATT